MASYFLVVLLMMGVQMTSTYVINETSSDKGNEEAATDLQDDKDADVDFQTNDEKRDRALLAKIFHFIKYKNLEQKCFEEAAKGTRKLLKEKREEEELVLAKNFQILQHGEQSFVENEEWFRAIKSEKCTGCLLRRLCDKPPTGLPSNKLACRRRVLEIGSLALHINLKKKCNPCIRFRSIDGMCNNLKNPTWGAAGAAFVRIEGPDYADFLSKPRQSQANKDLPNARDVSRKVHGSNADQTNPDSKTLSHLAMTWGQFLDHDITIALTSGLNCEPKNKDPECVNIEIPKDDKTFRGRGATFIEVERDAPKKPSTFCSLKPREHVNRLTAFIDGSQIYGPEKKLMEDLQGNSGQLRDMEHKHGCPFKNMLPKQKPDLFCVSKDPHRPCFMSGDDRTNENQGLMSMHTLWLREHNRIAKRFVKITNWDADRIYQETRKIIGAQLQVITYNEFLPLILGDKMINDFNLRLLERKEFFKGYNPDVDPSIFAAFAVAAYRFGHSLVQEEFPRFTQKGFQSKNCQNGKEEYLPIPLKDFGNPFYLYEKCQGGIDSIFRGLVKSAAAKADGKFSSSVQENLFRGPGDLSDLVAINIQRSRERGVPSYVTYRNTPLCNIQAKIDSFDDLERIGFAKEDVKNLKSVYHDVQDIDLFTGALLEPPVDSTKGGVLGPTFQCLIAEQFRRLRVGDRFWYENRPNKKQGTDETAFTACQLQEIRKTTLAKVICNNSDNILTIRKEALSLMEAFVDCEELPEINLNMWKNNYDCQHE